MGRLRVLCLVGVVSLFGRTARAEIVFDGSPGTGPPPELLCGYEMLSFPPDDRPLFEDVLEVPTPGGEPLLFSIPLSHRQIGSGWSGWSHGYSGDVYYTNGESAVTLLLPEGTAAFYFYAEPNQFGVFQVMATAQDGTTSGPVLVDGAGGATYFGFCATGSDTIASVAVEAEPAAAGFAVGEFGVFVEGGEPFGACCLPEGECLDELFGLECADLGGEFFPGQGCDQVDCPGGYTEVCPDPCNPWCPDYHPGECGDRLTEPGSKHEPVAAPCECPVCAEPTASTWLDPVYLFSGEFYETVVDLHIAGRGPEFTWARKYRSRIGPSSAQGNGWSWSYDVRLEAAGPDRLVADGGSRRDLYTLQGDGTWAADEFFRVLEEHGDGTYTLTFSDTGTWDFHALDGSPQAGRLSALQDRNGQTMTFAYDGAGRLVTISDALDRDVSVAYNADGFIESVTDFAGRQVTYEYYADGDAGGGFGDLKSVTTPAVEATADFPLPPGHEYPDGKTTVYTYTTGFADERLNHDLLTVTDPKGQTYLQNVYAHTVDAGDPRHTTDRGDLYFDRLVRQVWGDAGDLIDVVYTPEVPTADNHFAVLKAIVNDRVGDVKELFFDADNRGVIQREYTGRWDADQPTFDPIGAPPTARLRAGDPDFFETRYTYNADALVSEIVYPNGNVEEKTYELDLDPMAPRRSRGNLREVRRTPGTHVPGGDQSEIVGLYEYDSDMGGCCGTNFVTREVDGRGNETLHEYDDAGNRVRTIHRIPGIVEEWEYNAFGQLTAHLLPDNGSGHLRRDELVYYDSGPQEGYLHQQIVDAGGLALTSTYEYDLVGNRIRATDPRGNDRQRVFNQLNQVVLERSREVELPAGGGSPVRYEEQTFYDANDNVVRVDVQNIDDQGVLQPNAVFTTLYEYEILDRLVRVTDEVDAGHSMVTEYEYDANRNRTLLRKGEATSGDDPDNVVAMAYDERDLLFREIRAPGSAEQSTEQYDYDGNRSRVRTTSGLEGTPRVTEQVYDGYDRVVSRTDPLGNVTTYHYDANANRTSTLVEGELADVAGGAGNVRLSEIAYFYDDMDRRTRVEKAFFDTATQVPLDDGLSVAETVYSDNSQVVLERDDNGHETATAYDTANRVSSITDALGNAVTYAYDANSNLLTTTGTELSDLGSPAEVFVTTYTYDARDRLILTVDNIGNPTASAYDSRDNPTVTVDALGHETRYRYDGLDRLIATVGDLDGDGADGDGADITTTREWDDSSRLVGQGDDNGNVTAYTYDSLDRRTATVYADGTAEQVLAHDVHDNPLQTVDANGSQVTFSYDLLDRVTDKSVVPGPEVSSDTTLEMYVYDGLSRMVQISDDDSLVVRQYDSLSRITSETLNGETTTSVHDGVGNRVTCTYPGGRTVTCTYDALNRRKTVSDGGGLIAEYSYIGPERVERREYGNNTRAEYAYDGIQRMVGTTHTADPGGAATGIDERTYTWDAMSNKTLRRDVRPGGPQLEHAYTYDAFDRLTRTVVTDGDATTVRDTTYDLDGVGNRRSVGGPGGGDYHLDPLLPPGDWPVNQYTATPQSRREHDANGNLTWVSQPGDWEADGDLDLDDHAEFVACLTGPGVTAGWPCRRFDTNFDNDVDLADFRGFGVGFTGSTTALPAALAVYDYRNRMVEYIDVLANRRHTYAYDALGRRIARVVDADGSPAETRYFHDGWRVVEEQDAGGATQASYVHGIYIDEVLTMRRAGSDLYYHSDDLYNVMALTDAAGTVVERYEYGDYGRPTLPVVHQTFPASPPEWTFLGAAAHSAADGGVVRLVSSGEKVAAGAAFHSPAGYATDRFEVEFDFAITNPDGSFEDEAGLTGPDGLAFVVAGAVPGAPGGFGTDLGYGGLPLDSFAVEFDSFQNEFDPDSNHLGIDVGGSVESIATAAVAPDLEAGTGRWHARVVFDSGKLTVTLTSATEPGSVVLAAVIPPENVPAVKYFGFTSGTGLNSADTDVDNVQVTLFESAAGNPYLFNGREYDIETGWYQYRTRYLDPLAGRFTTRDTIGIWGDPVNLGNGYAYVGNAPWNAVDPIGLRRFTLSRTSTGGWGFVCLNETPGWGYLVGFGETRREARQEARDRCPRAALAPGGGGGLTGGWDPSAGDALAAMPGGVLEPGGVWSMHSEPDRGGGLPATPPPCSKWLDPIGCCESNPELCDMGVGLPHRPWDCHARGTLLEPAPSGPQKINPCAQRVGGAEGSACTCTGSQAGAAGVVYKGDCYRSVFVF